MQSLEDLLARNEIDFELMDSVADVDSVTNNKCAYFYNLVYRDPVFTSEWFSSTSSQDETLTLLYYGGYLTVAVCCFYPMVLSVLISAKDNGRCKIPNQEVTMDWAKWIFRK
jgi:hypothetical protein